jgi:hypothetical protein
MKPLYFMSAVIGLVAAACHFPSIAWIVIFLLMLGSALLVIYSLYRHLAANRLL